MTVAELIEFLKAQPQNIQVGYRCFSEYCTLEEQQIHFYEGCIARPDGWIQRARPDMPKVQFLIFPGN